MGTTDFDGLFKTLFEFDVQKILFIGIFIAFAVKTPFIFLNLWLLKAHVESPLGGSVILAAIVLKLSLYGIYRLILPILSKASLIYTPLVYVFCVITIIYASINTVRTIDLKEIVAYSSVAHAAVYILGSFSNSVIGIEGAITLGLAHAFASTGLFICVGGVLYDRYHTRLISLYRGITQLLPIFSILFFVLCLANMSTPLTVNFIGEFMCLYGAFERLPLMGALACSSIILSAAFTIYLYNRVAFGGTYSLHLTGFTDLNKREYTILLTLVGFIVILGIYPALILDGLHYSVSTLIYSFDAEHVMFFLILNKLNYKYFKSNRYMVKNYSVSTAERFSNDTSLKPGFISGFTDAEGCFLLLISKDSRTPNKTRYNYNLSYTIGLHQKDLLLLKKVQAYFKGAGSITTNLNVVSYRISSLEELKLVIDHFDKYPLITQKYSDYILFKKAFELVSKGDHLTETGWNKLLSIKSAINKGLSEELKKVYPNVTAIERPLVKDQTITPEWFAGFTSGEGCFFLNVFKNPSKTGFKTILRFKINQHIRDKALIESFIKFFNCGTTAKHSANAVTFLVSKFSDVNGKIIPFFKEYPVLGVKSLDFDCWCQAAEIVKTKGHLTPEGLEKIMDIKANMNKNRVIDETIEFEVSDDSDAFDFANNSKSEIKSS